MRRIGNFTVEDTPLAKGGMGQIFKGRNDYGHPIAVKEILPEFATDFSIIDRIQREVEFMVKIDHPSIVKLHAAFRDPQTECYYIVMELVDGLNIEQYVMRKGPIPPDRAVELMVKILDAIQCVHSSRIVHRDIKPSNIMIRSNGNVCLLDFGVAKDLGPATGHPGTVAGTVIGTTGYMSPEQANGNPIDYRSDIYALGCVFFYMLTGHHAFNTFASEFETKDAILCNEFPRLSKYNKNLPGRLQQVLDKATAKDKNMRYSSCYEFIADLRNGTHVSGVSAPTGPVKVTIGRDMCDITIDDPERKISRHHADIELVTVTGGDYYALTDCSSNGTLVGNRMLRGGTMRISAHGQLPDVYLAGMAYGRLDWSKITAELRKRAKAMEVADMDEIETAAKTKVLEENKTPEVPAPQEEQKPVAAKHEHETGPEKYPADKLEDMGEEAPWKLVWAFVFVATGGLLGVFLGANVANSKVTLTDGTKIHKYKKSHRKLGRLALILGIISIVVWQVAYALAR